MEYKSIGRQDESLVPYTWDATVVW